MKSLKLIAALTAALFLSACEDAGPGPEDIVGSWARPNALTTLTFTHLGDNRFEVEHFSLDNSGREVRNKSQAILEENRLIVGEAPFAIEMIYDAETDRIHVEDRVYRPVPDGWVWSDGFDGLD